MSQSVTITYRYIEQTPNIHGGRPVIKGTQTPVKSIVGYYKLGLSVEGILEGLPYLTPAQIFEALSHYHDHQAKIEQDIEASRTQSLIEREGLQVTADGRLIANDDDPV